MDFRFRFFTTMAASLSVAIFLFAPIAAFASTDNGLSDAQSGAISQHCASIKQSLRTLQRTDARTRSYLGSAYERAISDFITPLDLRLINVSQPNAGLTELHSKILSAREDFVRQYTIYSQSLEELINSDCQSSPNSFYDRLIETREKRVTLSKTTDSLRRLLAEHLSTVKKLDSSLEGGANNE